MSLPWGTTIRSHTSRITSLSQPAGGGPPYDYSYDVTVKTQVIDRYNHTSNPPDATGFRMPSPYLVSTSAYSTKSGSWTWTGANGNFNRLEGEDPSWIEDHVGTAGPAMIGLSLTKDSNAESQAITECLNKLADSKTAILQNLATVYQTADLLGETVSNLAKALAAVKRGNFRKGFRTTVDGVGNLYLIYKYGWEPLFNDASGAISMILDANKTPRVSAIRNVSRSASYSGNERGYRWKSKYTTRAKCKLWATIEDGWARRINQAGDSVANLPFVGWDLVPWSFAVDWVLPVGNILQALSATAGLSFSAGYISNSTKGEADVTKIPPQGTSSSSDFGGRFNGQWYQRRPLSGFPMPEPYVKSPFSATHALESLALLNQLIK